MDAMRDSSTVGKQYADGSNLRTRVSLHSKYSTNKRGFGNWIASHYKDFEGSRILELGCGTGDFWKDKKESIAGFGTLVISDFSEGMLQAARQNIGDAPNVEFRRIDMQSIPYADATFDFIIAHMMLYHVPSLDKRRGEAQAVFQQGAAARLSGQPGNHRQRRPGGIHIVHVVDH